jgi:predicted transcriptional regulator
MVACVDNVGGVIELDPFVRAFVKILKARGIQGKEVAEWTGRTPGNISRIRNGQDSPRLRDFMQILMAIEKRCPGFFDDFCRQLSGQSRRLTISPEEFVNSLDSSEFAALMIAAGRRLSKGAASYEC